MQSFKLVLACVVVSAMAAVGLGEATPITSFGAPVIGVGSSTGAVPNCPSLEGQVCYDAATGSIGFFIPLTTAHAGTYGVTNVGQGNTAGTFSDVGGGTENHNALTMFLRFSPVAIPAQTASLRFDFIDLDLRGVNDPTAFFESVRFYQDDGQPLTPLIRMVNQTPPAGSPYTFTVSGDSTHQSIYFPNVASLVDDPFYLQLRFRTSYNSTGQNTPESMIATLTSEGVPPPPPPPVRVPEPRTLTLVGAGLVTLGAFVRRPKVRGRRRA